MLPELLQKHRASSSPKTPKRRESLHRWTSNLWKNRIEPPNDQIKLRSSNSHTKLSQLTRSLTWKCGSDSSTASWSLDSPLQQQLLRRTSHESTTAAAAGAFFAEPQSSHHVHRHFLHTMRCDATDQLEGNARLVVVSGLRTGVLRVWWALAFVCLELGEEQRGATTKGVVAWRWRICKCKFSKMQVWKSSLRREEKRVYRWNAEWRWQKLQRLLPSCKQKYLSEGS